MEALPNIEPLGELDRSGDEAELSDFSSWNDVESIFGGERGIIPAWMWCILQPLHYLPKQTMGFPIFYCIEIYLILDK